nr:translation initiation factor IF-3 [Arthrobacter pigmenti]
MVGPAGEQVGIVRIEDALRLAAESDLDLVEVAPQAKPPVAKLMDFGKYKYEAAVKAREARKNQTNTVLKEIRFRLKIDTHDYETKRGHALRFLGAGDKVKAMIQFRGREQQRPEMGIRLLQRFAEDVAEVGVVESTPRIDGRNMVMVIGPVKNKAEAKAEARRAAQRAESKAANEKSKVDTTGAEPMTQSIGDLLPEGLRSGGDAAADGAETPSTETPSTETAQTETTQTETTQTETTQTETTQTETTQTETTQAETPQAEDTSTSKPVAEAPNESVEAPKQATQTSSGEAKTVEKPAATATVKSPAATKAAAPAKEAAPAPKAKEESSAAVSKPAAAPKPQAAPKPSASAKPAAAPKPSAAKPAATPKPAGKAVPAKGSPSRPKPGGSS